MTSIRSLIDGIGARHIPKKRSFEPVERAAQGRRRVGTIIASFLIAAAGIGLAIYSLSPHTRLASPVDQPAASPARPYVAPPLDADGQCVPPGGDSNALTSVSFTGAIARTHINVSGPVPHLMEDGSYDDSEAAYQIWWNVDDTNWTEIGGQAAALAAGEQPKFPIPDGVQMLGQQIVTTECAFSVQFTVPNDPPGTYPVTVINAGGGSATNRATFAFTILES